MSNNITKDDLEVLVSFLSRDPAPILTSSGQVLEFEKMWSAWLGVKHSVFVNSGSSANILTMAVIKYLYGDGEVITAPFGWVSDIAAILHSGLKPVFCDITLKNLSIDESELERRITSRTKALLLTHILGYNALSDKIVDLCEKHNVKLIEDACESHGALFKGRKVGSFGAVSNFSFYYAHHLTSIEGGMICTNDDDIYQLARVFRSHGMLRESTDERLKSDILANHADLNRDFVFIAPTYNMRSTEINAVLAINQMKRLDANNAIRSEHLNLFLDNLDGTKFYTGFDRAGNSNYAFTLLLSNPDVGMRDKVESALRANDIEFRRGMSGGGNQLRQPYLKALFHEEYLKYPICEYVHHYGWYIGNYPDLEKGQILRLCEILNRI